MDVGEKDAPNSRPDRGTGTMIYDVVAIVGVVVILGTIVGVLWAASRV